MIDENPSIYTGVLYLALFFLFSDQSINSNQKKKGFRQHTTAAV